MKFIGDQSIPLPLLPFILSRSSCRLPLRVQYTVQVLPLILLLFTLRLHSFTRAHFALSHLHNIPQERDYPSPANYTQFNNYDTAQHETAHHHWRLVPFDHNKTISHAPLSYVFHFGTPNPSSWHSACQRTISRNPLALVRDITTLPSNSCIPASS